MSCHSGIIDMPLHVKVFGKDEWVAKQRSRVRSLPQALIDEMQTQMTQTADYVRSNKLSGEVLQRRSGALSRSIYGAASISGNTVVGILGSRGVPYANIWENTGSAAHDVKPITAKALRFLIGGQAVFAMRAHIPQQPARPFLKPSLKENQDKILNALRGRVLQVLST
jgi:hypothetical protein